MESTPKSEVVTFGLGLYVLRGLVVLMSISAALSTGCTGPDNSRFETVNDALAITGDLGLEEELALTEARVLEDAIQECMALRGFEYHKENISVETVFGSEVGAGLDKESWARQYGFGFAPIMLESLNDLPTEADEAASGGEANNEYLNTLSDSERELWYQSLRGTGFENDSLEPCTDVALSELEQDSILVRVSGEFMRIYTEEIPSDERMIKAQEEWVKCVTEKGYEFTSREDLESHFSEQASLATRSVDGEAAALTEKANVERAVAVDLVPCETRFDETFQLVREDYETRLLEQDPDSIE